ncbi:MAG TPA: AAA family ATPase, partial [Solirubrobacteraceae bacterium]|nr:AAA family ATPase [Solirubrobacteraceae bacterium]
MGEPGMYGGGEKVKRVEVRETHGSRVFLAGELGYKVKKPIRLDFFDYSTLARRLAACREEVRVNRRLAEDLYVGVRAIVADEGGFRFAPEEAAGAVEYAVLMERFREQDTLAGLIEAGELRGEDVDAVARRLASFHREAARVPATTRGRRGEGVCGSAAELAHRWEANVEQLAGIGAPGEWHVDVARGFGERFVGEHEELIEARRRAGLVREGHGDLRCDHVLARPRVRVVDAIEFDVSLARLDVAFDLAFLAMDLEAHGRRDAAERLLAAYGASGGELAGEPLESFYGAHWAMVRAKVALLAGRREQAGARWELGEALCWRARARAGAGGRADARDTRDAGARGRAGLPFSIVVCGPAGTGKSTLASELAERSEAGVLASDVLRRRMAGLGANERGGAELYRSERVHEVYELLAREAGGRLERGESVIVDATCRARADRAPILRALRDAGVGAGSL